MNDAKEQQLKYPDGELDCQQHDESEKLRMQISEMEELVSIDALTGLYNFRHFEKVIQIEMDRAKRGGVPTTLVMANLDHFRNINNTYGHEIGNSVLSHVAEIIKNEVRTTDCACRYGGDEFALIFPETHLNLAVKVADRIRETIASTPVKCDKGNIHITASMGASVYLKTSIIDIETFISSVNKFLNEAKQSGRNCICHIDYAGLAKVTEIGLDERAKLFGNNS